MVYKSGFTRRAFGQWLGKAGLAASAILSGCAQRTLDLVNPKIDCKQSATTTAAEYDYIIVGSGAGGGPLAANLARKGHKVLLMEAGGDDENDHYRIPVFHTLASEDPALRWDFFVQHYENDKAAHQDPKYSELNGGIFYPRSGTLGGCTAHNAMITVYPHNSDWDYIAKITGDLSWRSDNMRQYFERLENCQYVDPADPDTTPSRHGFRGWLSTNIPGKEVVLDGLKDRQLRKVILFSIKEALKQKIGLPFRRIDFDPNDWRNVKRSAEGLCKLPLSTQNGRRVGSREYIKAVQQVCGNRLTVKLHSLVTKVLFDDDQNAIGVEYRHGQRLYRADREQKAGSEGETAQVFARREVILAGGAFNTPQLLMLSGVGPKEELTKHKIPVKVNLPGVGKNLQDRYEISVITQMKNDFSMLQGAPFKSPQAGSPPDPFYADWLQGKGIYTSNGVSVSFIKRSDPKQPEPDLFVFGMSGYFAGYYPGYSEKTTKHQDFFTWAILKAHTHNNAGTILLKSTDPLDTPEINFRYFDEGNDDTGEDLASVVSGIRFVRKINERSKNFIRKEVIPGEGLDSDDQLKDFIKTNAWGHHASCSCKMGDATDPLAVVDSEFRVIGTGRLRIVDASVFPKIPGFFIVSAIYMVSEKAAEVIHQASLDK
ncbi:MAG: GMC oxidoreductase [Methylococcaceae bacterium]